MVPRPAIPARATAVSAIELCDRKSEKPGSLTTGAMAPNPQVDTTGAAAFGPQADPNKLVIDLTDDPDEDLEKAIALSLQEEQERNSAGYISEEQADIDRAVAESMSVSGRKKVTFRETENPADRLRQGDWPVGLKNVGNSCWFSAVIQSLFHIPEFRRLVFKFNPQLIGTKELDPRDQRNVTLVTNLRRLFALMISGKMKHLDPSDCISILKSGLGHTFSQHDVSETTHLLLEWLEEAFSLWNRRKLEEEGIEKGQMELESEGKGESSTGTHQKNPLVDLFYGQVSVQSSDGDEVHSRVEPFSQCMIQVAGMSDLHQGIEASAKESVEPSHPEIQSPSKSQSSQSYKVLRSLGLIRERWFETLPPVLTFELNRFRFNSESQRSEKIHNRVTFPRVIYMDRYLKENKNTTVEIRSVTDELLRRRQALEDQVKAYEEYGNESQKYSLSRVLRYARQFVETRKPSCTHSSQPMPSTSSMGGEHQQPSEKLKSAVSTRRRRSLSELEIEPMEVDHDCKRRRFLTDGEYRLISSCLDELHEEVCIDLEQAGKEIAKLDMKIETIYVKPELQKVPYVLHAVMVHGGEAASGHYWSYIWDQSRETWLKFNDHLVTEVSWTDLEKDAYGGLHTKASAYCLIYLDEKRKNTLIGSNAESELPEDLSQFVTDETHKLEKECRNWEEKQKEQPMEVQEVAEGLTDTKNDQSVGTEPPVSLDINKWEVVPPGSSFDIEKKNLEKAYAEDATGSAIDVWNKFFESELATYDQVRRIVADQKDDLRTVNFVCYLVANGYSNYVSFSCLVVISRCLPHLVESRDQSADLVELVNHKLIAAEKCLNNDDVNELNALNKSFKDFLVDVHGFIYAVDCIRNKKMYDQCVPILSRIFIDGRTDRLLSPRRRLSSSVILKSLRICLPTLSNFYIDQFRQSDNGDGLAQEIQMTLVPGIVVLSLSHEKCDGEILERLRNDWCELISDGSDEPHLDKILQLLLDCRESPELIKNLPGTPIHRQTDLHGVFNDALRFIESSVS